MANKQRNKKAPTKRSNQRRRTRSTPSKRNHQRQMLSTAAAYQEKAMPPLMQSAVDTGNSMAQTTVTGAELAQKAFDAAQSPAMGVPTKWLDFWSSSIRAAQANVSLVSTITTQLMRSWIQLVQLHPQRS